MWNHLKNDPVVRLSGAFGALIAVLYLATNVAGRRLGVDGLFYSEMIFTLIVIVAALSGLRRITSFEERRFWWLIAGSYALSGTTFFFYYGDWQYGWTPAWLLAEDSLNLGSYVLTLAAVIVSPAGASRGRQSARVRIELLGTVVFAAGLALYFIVIPDASAAGTADTYLPTLALYVVLSLLVAGALLYRSNLGVSRRWMRVFVLLAAAEVLWALLTSVDMFFEGGALDISWDGQPHELIWMSPYFLVIAAVRLSRSDSGAQTAAAADDGFVEGHETRFGVLLVSYLLLIPIIHFVLYWTGQLDADFLRAREITVVVAMLALASLVIANYARLMRRRDELAEKMRRAEKMEALDTLSAGVAHNFNNMLMAITGFAQLALGKTGRDDPRRTDLEKIIGVVQSAAELTRQLLAFARERPLRHEVMDFDSMIREHFDMLEPLVREDIVVTLSLGAGHGDRVDADSGQMSQVLVNLVVNAQDAMPDGGELSIVTGSTTIAPRGAERLGIVAGDYVFLRVADTGHGMDAATLAQIFDPFFTTKEVGKGTGMGLGTVRGIVAQHGGRVDVRSDPGEGTTFEMYLPVTPLDAELRRADAATTGPETTVPGTVLVVEDEDIVRSVVARMLQSRGYSVLSASDPAEANEVLNTHGGEVSLLLTDVVMPGGSGKDLYERSVQRWPNLKVLFMSGYAGSPSEPATRLHGEFADLLLHKPFTAEALCAMVDEVLSR